MDIDGEVTMIARFIAFIAALATLTPALPAATTPSAEIRNNRMGAMTVVVRDQNGDPLRGARVNYRQTDRAFSFGFFDFPYNPAIVSTMRDAGFDQVTMHLNWELAQPRQGEYNWGGVDYFYDSAAYKAAGLTVKAHALLWFQAEFFPTWLKGKSFAEIKNFAAEHVRQVVRHYRDRVDIWEALNEGCAYWANELGFSEAQMIELTKTAATVIRAEDPTAKILVNNATPARDFHYGNPYPLDYMRKVKAAGVDFDIVGLQVYYDPYVRGGYPRAVTIADLEQMIDDYASLGKEIHITEFSVPSGPTAKTSAWTEARQAEWMTQAYTLFFSKKAVTAVTWWNVTDRRSYIQNGGLINSGGGKKAAFAKLAQMISSWTTTGSGVTDRNGELYIQGFAGGYELSIADAGVTATLDVTINEGAARRLVYNFNPKRIAKNNARADKKYNDIIRQRRNQAESLVNYWERMGDKAKAAIGRKGLESVEVANAHPSAISVLEELENLLDRLAVDKTRTITARELRVLGGELVDIDDAANFWTDGMIGARHSFEGRTATVRVHARGHFADGAPIYVLSAGPLSNTGEVKLASESWREYESNLTVTPGSTDLKLLFANDFWSKSGGDRNLFIERITIVEKSWVAPTN